MWFFETFAVSELGGFLSLFMSNYASFYLLVKVLVTTIKKGCEFPSWIGKVRANTLMNIHQELNFPSIRDKMARKKAFGK